MAYLLELPELPIRVNGRGEWLHGDQPLHPRVATLFARHVVPTPEGAYFIQIGAQRQPLEVVDTPYWVRACHVDAPGEALRAVKLRISDGAEELLDPTTLMQSEDNVLYCRVQRSHLLVPCRFTPAQYHTLALYMETEGEGFVLPVGAQRHALAPFDPRPIACS